VRQYKEYCALRSFLEQREPTVDLNLNGAIVLVTGGSKGIGLACASAFAAEGARLASPFPFSFTNEGYAALAEFIWRWPAFGRWIGARD
jgi:hypothetical protein